MVIFFLIFLFKTTLILQSEDFLDRSWLPSLITITRIAGLTMGLLLNLHLSSYVARKTQDFSITANVIVLFLLWVMKDVILICLMTTLPQFMWMASVSTSTLDLLYMFRYTGQFCRLILRLRQSQLVPFADHGKGLFTRCRVTVLEGTKDSLNERHLLALKWASFISTTIWS